MFSTTAFHPSMARKLYFLKGHIFKAKTMEEEMMLGDVTQTQKNKHCAFPGRCRAKVSIFTFVCGGGGGGGIQVERKRP